MSQLASLLMGQDVAQSINRPRMLGVLVFKNDFRSRKDVQISSVYNGTKLGHITKYNDR